MDAVTPARGRLLGAPARGAPLGVAARGAAWGALTLACAIRVAHAEPIGATRAEIESAYLFHFARFVEWPEDALGPPGAPLIVGVLGEDPFGVVLDRTLADKRVRGRPIAVRRFDTADAARASHVLFVWPSEAARLPSIFETLRGRSVLTVSDIPGFAERGGVIEFVQEGEHVRFLVNIAAARAVRLHVPAQLLSLARRVYR